jgi:hypothetical protein
MAQDQQVFSLLAASQTRVYSETYPYPRLKAGRKTLIFARFAKSVINAFVNVPLRFFCSLVSPV